MQPLAPSDSDLGSVFIGWGRCPTFTEHNSAGKTVLDVQFSPWHSDDIPDALDNYRAYKMDWVATPWWDPAIAVRQDANGTLVVYASWNGATEVASWAIRGTNHSEGDNAKGLVLATSQRAGFETRLKIAEDEAHYRYLWAEALDAQGNILRSSEVVDFTVTEILSDSYSSAFYKELGLESLSSLLSVWNNGTQATEPAATAADSVDASPSYSSSPVHTRGLSTKALAFLGTGIGISAMTLVAIVVVIIRRRQRRDYNSLNLKESDFELDLDSDDCEEEVDAQRHEGEVDEDSEQSRMAGAKDEDTHALLPKPG